MDTSTFIREYKTLPEPDIVIPIRSMPKIKSHPYPFRDIAEFDFSRHARKRMEERRVADSDVAFVLRYGRALPLERNSRTDILIFLCPGELPKRKAKQKMFVRLKGVALVVRSEQPFVVTVLNPCFLWRKLIYQKPSWPSRSLSSYSGY